MGGFHLEVGYCHVRRRSVTSSWTAVTKMPSSVWDLEHRWTPLVGESEELWIQPM